MIPNQARAAISGQACPGLAPIILITITAYLVLREARMHLDQGRADRNVGDDMSLVGDGIHSEPHSKLPHLAGRLHLLKSVVKQNYCYEKNRMQTRRVGHRAARQP